MFQTLTLSSLAKTWQCLIVCYCFCVLLVKAIQALTSLWLVIVISRRGVRVTHKHDGKRISPTLIICTDIFTSPTLIICTYIFTGDENIWQVSSRVSHALWKT